MALSLSPSRLSLKLVPLISDISPLLGLHPSFSRDGAGECFNKARSAVISIKKALISQSFFLVGGRDGTRTRDPVRDRHVF